MSNRNLELHLIEKITDPVIRDQALLDLKRKWEREDNSKWFSDQTGELLGIFGYLLILVLGVGAVTFPIWGGLLP